MMDLCSFFFNFGFPNEGRKWKRIQETVLSEAWTRDTCPVTQYFVKLDKILSQLNWTVEPVDFDFHKFVPRNHLLIFSTKSQFDESTISLK